MHDVDVLHRGPFLLGEGPRWDAARGRLWWVDILGRRILSAPLDRADDPASIATPAPVGFVAPGDGFLVAGIGLGVSLIDDAGIVELAATGHQASVATRMNDGVVDPAGRLFAGVMGFDGEEGQGALYRASADGLERVIDAMTIPNGLGWSVDGSTMYVTDSGRQAIDAHDYDVSTGELGPARPFVEIAGDGAPDGMCVDADGGVWTAVWGAGEVRRYTADGVLDDVVTVPARQPSACCFAGADLDVLVVTSATKDLAAPGELDGALFAVRPGVTGRPLTPVDRTRLPR